MKADRAMRLGQQPIMQSMSNIEPASLREIQIRTDDFKTKPDLDRWLKKASNYIKVINVATTKRWGFTLGFLGDKKSYTVTYEKLVPEFPWEAADRQRKYIANLFVLALTIAWIAVVYFGGHAGLPFQH